MTRLGTTTFRRFVRLAKPFFTSEKRYHAIALGCLLLGLSLTNNLIASKMSYIVSDFMTALSKKDSETFFQQLTYYIIAFIAATPFVVFYSYTEQRLSLMWRRWLSHHTLSRYFSNRIYYRLNLRAEVDNPDQRIEADVREFCASTLMFGLILFNSVVQMFLFTYILYEISGWLVIAAFGYAAFGSLVTFFFGRPLIGLNFAQRQKDADYRYKLINVRDSAESIALYGREAREYTRTRQRLKWALQNALKVITWNRNLDFFTKGYNYLLTVLPTIIVAPLFFNGSIEFGRVIQAGGVFGVVINALSIVVNHFSNLSNLAAVIDRLGSFWEGMDRAVAPIATGEHIRSSIAPALSFKSVTICTPRREQVLIKNLSFTMHGSSLLLCGPSGSGKSSILRVIAGLWESGSGVVTRPDPRTTLFVPQRPYMVLGSLRSQLLYGVPKRGVLDRELKRVLDMVRLTEMYNRVGGLDAVLDWPNVLGTGEQQRIAFARVLLIRPKVVFLDEATTAMDRATEEELYRILPRFVEQYISTGSPIDLREYHEHILQLNGDGTWLYE